jgi:hypothetical protein
MKINFLVPIADFMESISMIRYSEPEQNILEAGSAFILRRSVPT